MSLYVESRGRGPDLVLLHGFGVHGGIFDPIVPALAKDHRVTVPDLPGHGHSRGEALPPALADWTAALKAALPARAHYLGWSLGGLLALSLALSSDAVERLILVSTSPRFVAGEGWDGGTDARVLGGFANELKSDYRGALTRFLGLQVGLEAGGRALLRDLREVLFARGAPSQQALDAALALLRDTDLRERLPGVRAPALVLHGDRDRVVPLAGAQALARGLPAARLHRFPGAGHVPFLSSPAAFLTVTRDFLCTN